MLKNCIQATFSSTFHEVEKVLHWEIDPGDILALNSIRHCCRSFFIYLFLRNSEASAQRHAVCFRPHTIVSGTKAKQKWLSDSITGAVIHQSSRFSWFLSGECYLNDMSHFLRSGCQSSNAKTSVLANCILSSEIMWITSMKML